MREDSEQPEDFGSVASHCSSAQSVQRCRIQSDTRYGAVHRLGRLGTETDCGLNISDGGWWVLGNELKHAVTCRACLKVR